MTNTITDPGTASDQPFRLLDLPQELQDKIYEKYFEDAPRAMFRRRHPNKVSLRLERASHKVCSDARRTKSRVWPRVLEINAAEYPEASRSPVWLRDLIEEIRIEHPIMDQNRPHAQDAPDVAFYLSFGLLKRLRVVIEAATWFPFRIGMSHRYTMDQVEAGGMAFRIIKAYRDLWRLRDRLTMLRGHNWSVQVYTAVKHWSSASTYTFHISRFDHITEGHDYVSRWTSILGIMPQHQLPDHGTKFSQGRQDLLLETSPLESKGDRLNWLDGLV